MRLYAASSLTQVMRQFEAYFEAAHPDIDVQLTLAGSQVLRMQIEQGAPADVFISANPSHVDALMEQGLLYKGRRLAGNHVVLISPASAPPITRFEEVASVERIVVGAPTVPIGQYTERVLKQARRHYGDDLVEAIEQKIVSRELNVRLVRAKVALAEADAAFVYATDAVGVEQVTLTELPAALQVSTAIMVGIHSKAKRRPAVRVVTDELGGEMGRQLLRVHHFDVEDR